MSTVDTKAATARLMRFLAIDGVTGQEAAIGRDIAAALKQAGVPTAIYYPRPLHEQPAYAGHPVVAGGLPVAERLSRRVLSLPFHPYLDAVTQDYIIDQLRTALAAR